VGFDVDKASVSLANHSTDYYTLIIIIYHLGQVQQAK
jgi:hypothetical protein